MSNREIETYTLTLKDYIISQCVAKDVFLQRVRVNVSEDYATNCIVTNIISSVLGTTLFDFGVSYPTTWWDGFKKEYFPNWLLVKFPVNMTRHEFSIDELYPKLNIALPDNKDKVLKLRKNKWVYDEQ